MTLVPDDPKRRQVAQLGKYAIWYDPLPHRPYGLFRVYHGERLVGSQLSMPCESDCRWLEHHKGVYATSSFRDDEPWGWVAQARGVARRRGRPRKDESLRQLQEALAA